MLFIIVSCVPCLVLPYFSHYLIKGNILRKNLWFSLQIFLKQFTLYEELSEILL